MTVGYGSANANTSVMLGNQFDDSNKRLMPTYFSYWCTSAFKCLASLVPLMQCCVQMALFSAVPSSR